MIFRNCNIFQYVIEINKNEPIKGAINGKKSTTLNKKPKVDVTMDTKLGVESDVKLAIKTRCER